MDDNALDVMEELIHDIHPCLNREARSVTHTVQKTNVGASKNWKRVWGIYIYIYIIR